MKYFEEGLYKRSEVPLYKHVINFVASFHDVWRSQDQAKYEWNSTTLSLYSPSKKASVMTTKLD